MYCINTFYLLLKFIIDYNCVSSLRPVDVEFMGALQNKVNLVPVLGKADCLTLLELSRKKRKVCMSSSFVNNPTLCRF